MDCSLSGFSVHGILQARTLEWVAISFSNAWKWKVKVKSLSHVWLSATPWIAAYQAPPSMGFSGQQYWSGVPLPSPNSYTTQVKYTNLFSTNIDIPKSPSVFSSLYASIVNFYVCWHGEGREQDPIPYLIKTILLGGAPREETEGQRTGCRRIQVLEHRQFPLLDNFWVSWAKHWWVSGDLLPHGSLRCHGSCYLMTC